MVTDSHMTWVNVGVCGASVEQNPPRNIGSIADYDPVNDRFGSLSQGYAPKPGDQHHEWEETVPEPRGQGRGQGQSLSEVMFQVLFLSWFLCSLNV